MCGRCDMLVRLRASIVAISAAVLVGALAVPAAQAAENPTISVSADKVGAPADEELDIYGTVKTVDGLSLDSGHFQADNDGKLSNWNWVTPPSVSIGQNSSNSWRDQGNGSFIDGDGPVLDYRISDPTNPAASNFWIRAWFVNPIDLPNTYGCAVYKGDPGFSTNTNSNVVDDSGYKCSVSNTSGWNPHPVFTVSRTQ